MKKNIMVLILSKKVTKTMYDKYSEYIKINTMGKYKGTLHDVLNKLDNIKEDQDNESSYKEIFDILEGQA